MTIPGIKLLWRVLVALLTGFKLGNHQRRTTPNRPVPFARIKALDEMANPRTPTKLRLLADNPSGRPLPTSEPAFATCPTTPPDWLTGESLAQWGKLAAALDANGMLNEANRNMLATYCDVLGAYIGQRRAGAEPDMKLVQQIRMLGREFGFTPSSQAGIAAPGKPDGKEAKNRFFG